ncbi:MAG: hypothetical protein KME23_00155 [Goleter apudmare HA4340-LM2]|jgi:hypothetical protein|nr:hypothetical protein [Goleter apudmare HA4340-LM2]
MTSLVQASNTNSAKVGYGCKFRGETVDDDKKSVVCFESLVQAATY